MPLVDPSSTTWTPGITFRRGEALQVDVSDEVVFSGPRPVTFPIDCHNPHWQDAGYTVRPFEGIVISAAIDWHYHYDDGEGHVTDNPHEPYWFFPSTVYNIQGSNDYFYGSPGTGGKLINLNYFQTGWIPYPEGMTPPTQCKAIAATNPATTYSYADLITWIHDNLGGVDYTGHPLKIWGAVNDAWTTDDSNAYGDNSGYVNLSIQNSVTLYAQPEGGYKPTFPSGHALTSDPLAQWTDFPYDTGINMDVEPFSLICKPFLASWSAPTGPQSYVAKTERSTYFSPTDLTSIMGLTDRGDWTLYFCFNDILECFGDNTGAFNVTVSKVGVTLTASSPGDRIHLSWTGPTFTSYNVYKFNADWARWDLVYNTTSTTWDDLNVSVGPVYQYYVAGVIGSSYETVASNVVSGQLQRGGFSMATARARQYQGIQFGIEGTPGTLVAATKRMVGMEIDQTPNIPVKTVTYAGYTGASGTQKGQQDTNAKFTGAGCFNNLTLLMALAFGVPTPTIANNGSTWNWTPYTSEPWSPASATIEVGSSAGAEKFGWATLESISLKSAENDFSIDGNIFGIAQVRDTVMTSNIVMTLAAAASAATSVTAACVCEDGSSANGKVIPAGTYLTIQGKTMVVTAPATVSTGSATLTVSALASAISAGDVAFSIPAIPNVPFDPENVGWYISTDGVSYTAIGAAMDGNINFSNLWKPQNNQNETNTFNKIKQLPPKIDATLTVEEGSNADDFMSYLNNGQQIWLGLKVNGPTINASPLVKHLFRLNIPMVVTKPDPGNKNDVQGNTFTFEHAYWQAKAFDLTIVNKLTALG